MDRVPKTINIIPTIFIFLSFITIFGNIATNGFQLYAGRDFNHQTFLRRTELQIYNFPVLRSTIPLLAYRWCYALCFYSLLSIKSSKRLETNLLPMLSLMCLSFRKSSIFGVAFFVSSLIILAIIGAAPLLKNTCLYPLHCP